MTFHENIRTGRNECCCMTLSREDKSRQVSLFSDPKPAKLTAASTCQPTFSGFTCYGFSWLWNGTLSQPTFCTSIFNLSWLKVDLFPICVVLSNFVDQWLWGVEISKKQNKKKKFVNLIMSVKSKFFLSKFFFKFEFSHIYFGYSQISLCFYGKCEQNLQTVDNLLLLAIQILLKWIKNIFIFSLKTKQNRLFVYTALLSIILIKSSFH